MALVKAFDREKFPVDFDHIVRWYVCPVEKHCFLHGHDARGNVVKVPSWINKMAYLIFYMRALSPHYVRHASATRDDFKKLHGYVIEFQLDDKKPAWTFSIAADGICINTDGVSYLLPEPLQLLFKEVAYFGKTVREEQANSDSIERSPEVFEIFKMG